METIDSCQEALSMVFIQIFNFFLDRLAYVLQSLLDGKMKIEELSSNLTPSTRNSVLLKFQTGKVDGIVCSDALARGIDIPNVDVVISYDAPRHVKTYIHRIGRTARAGRPGTAVTLLVPTELNAFQVRRVFFLNNSNVLHNRLLSGDSQRRWKAECR